MKLLSLIFPHQLFEENTLFQIIENKNFWIIEDSLFFGDAQQNCIQKFHWQKLLLHRTSMKKYQTFLEEKNYRVEYFDSTENILETAITKAKEGRYTKIVVVDTVDYYLSQRLETLCIRNNIELEIYESPSFLNTRVINQEYFEKPKKRFLQNDFYTKQRKRLNILLEDDGNPVGGKWNFDEANRKKVPKKIYSEIPFFSACQQDQYTKEAQKYIIKNFSNVLGNTEKKLLYPSDFQSSKSWLQDFLKQKFTNFGPYEDAICQDHTFLFHSVLTPMLNIGLITPQYILDETLQYAQKNNIDIESVEGFIRQIIGWREFMRGTYTHFGKEMRTKNVWNHCKKMPACFYEGTSGIQPIDDSIKKILDTGYCHHIERLMVLGGFFFLCEIDPKEIYTWFMELFIDSYDWVMVTNVFAMSQNACGDFITTKPYFSGSNYIYKMSDYKKGAEWAEIWDGLYWRWIWKHKDSLKKNPRWAMMCRTAEKMDSEKMNKHLEISEEFLQQLWK